MKKLTENTVANDYPSYMIDKGFEYYHYSKMELVSRRLDSHFHKYNGALKEIFIFFRIPSDPYSCVNLKILIAFMLMLLNLDYKFFIMVHRV